MRRRRIEDFRFQIADLWRMKPDELKDRTKQFALRVLKLVAAMPKTIEGRAIASQLVSCGTSVAVNYRATCRARSKAEFIAKVSVVLEEADEALLWLELIAEANLLPPKRVDPLLAEANELVAIMVASRKSAASNLQSAI
jgi:four helix bundle protein